MRAKYCYCKNTYTMKDCDSDKCKERENWKQGIGKIRKTEES